MFLKCLPFTLLLTAASVLASEPLLTLRDPQQGLERTCFQTGRPWSEVADLGSDVAIAYGIDPGLPGRVQTWRDHGYRVHVMTGVAWGQYQDYLFGRFDGINHEDEAQTGRDGKPHRHGNSKDIFYMCPGTNYGHFLCVGVQRALDAGVEAVHLEEPEFWVEDGYEEGFKREWRSFYHEDWQPPHSSVDAQWRASKLKYYLYRRALQQVFDYVQDYNRRTGRQVRCYVPTHSLLNYAHWRIVSPESSLARLNGCDGYIAQVWTGTSRTPNVYRGRLRERTFETAFLEYGAMQNLVRSTGRRVWYLNDPIEDNPDHDWDDYRRNWESTLTASLFQPEVWRYEVAPWPERIFAGRYPRQAAEAERRGIPAPYATELQTVMNALNDMNQQHVQWDCGAAGVGVLVSDSLMFQRGQPNGSDSHLGQVYGLALPLLKRGVPVTPVQLENVTVPHYLDGFRVLLLTYHGMKPLSAEVHAPLADWVRRGGALVVVDDDADPYARVREWWNTGGLTLATPRQHLYKELGLPDGMPQAGQGPKVVRVGKGYVVGLNADPAALASEADGDSRLMDAVTAGAKAVKLPWRETNYLVLRRGPYLVAAGLDESSEEAPRTLSGRFINLFDPDLKLQTNITLSAGARLLLLDLDAPQARFQGSAPRLLASACKSVAIESDKSKLSLTVEGVAGTPAIVLIRAPRPPKSIALGSEKLDDFHYSADEQLLRLRFANVSNPRRLEVTF